MVSARSFVRRGRRRPVARAACKAGQWHWQVNTGSRIRVPLAPKTRPGLMPNGQ
jgi:hypothetical protein